MKVIELLTKIANEKEYPKIKFNNSIYEYHDKEHGYCRYYHDNTYICLDTDYYLFDILNDEVEIIEEDKKIEKLETYDIAGNIFLKDFCFKYIPIDKEKLTANEQVFVNKINEIIDYINDK